MAVFENCSVLLELKTLPFKEKQQLRSAVTENGGNISFVVNKQCSLVVANDVSNLSANRLRSIQKHQTPVVGVDYVYRCLSRGVLLPVDEHKLDTSSSLPPLLSSPNEGSFSPQVSKVSTNQAVADTWRVEPHPSDSLTRRAGGSGKALENFRIYAETDSDLPTFPDYFHVAKYSVFEKVNSNTLCVLELQSGKGEHGRQYRVVRYWKSDVGAKKAAVKDKLVFVSTSEDALQVYLTLREALQKDGLQLRSDIPPQAQDLGSGPLQQLLLEEKLNTGSLSQEVGVFVELLWTEALGCLGNVLRVSVDQLSLSDVSRAEGLLLQAQRKLKEGNHTVAATLLVDVYTLLPHNAPQLLPSVQLISQKLDLCQLIRDVLSVSEMTLRSPVPSCVGKYRALRCSIEAVPSSSSEFQAVAALLQDSKVRIQQVLLVSRAVELQMFKTELGNIKPLLHSSSPSNFVGILSRGLLLPRVGVEHHGIERTDAGNLGSGIYFSDAISTSLKYSNPSVTDGSRLLLVCDVALGRCRDLHKRNVTLTEAPEGHHSVHGVRRTPDVHSEFEDDEYVVYSPDQVKLKYVVQFILEEDHLKEFRPVISTSPELCQPLVDQEVGAEDDGVDGIKNPLKDVKAGLLDSAGQQLPLQAVHVKGRLIDLLSQVIIFQKYKNTSSVPIEAKYVFPLDESAAVCGFEAFINGKHVVGKVKEKETARREYKQAIERGHGAYLMDQDAPDVFTISVGNLPPGATVLIKVTFVSELIVRDGGIFFSLPGSVAPWQESAALNQTTQVTLEKVCVTDVAASTREFTLDLSVEMPNEISSLQCLTHKVKLKRTDCKAVVSVLPGVVMGPEGFQLLITLSEVHLPRMWVEKHPDQDSQACMLVFYPKFEINPSSGYDEVVLLLDTSESMKGESLRMAQRLALQVLKMLDQNLRINIILFGTDHKEAFLTARPMVEARQAAEKFMKLFTPVGGSTELWRPLRALGLLPPTRGIRNLLLLSDGHIQNAEATLRLLRDNAQHSRLFTFGLGPTANRHMLRALAQAGAGAYEFFDTKAKHTWAEKVACQVKRMASPGCSSVSVKWQQFSPSAPTPVQAPKQIHALFNDCHTLVYGFVPHCTQASLLGNLSGQELQTMVSTTELQKTKGTFLHKLTARALIRDYEDGNLDTDEAEHEGKKAELKSYIVELSKEFSVLSQFTSFVAIEERNLEQHEQGFTDIPKVIAEEDVDILPYISWTPPQESTMEKPQLAISECSDRDVWFKKARTQKMRSYRPSLRDVQDVMVEAERLDSTRDTEKEDTPSARKGRFRATSRHCRFRERKSSYISQHVMSSDACSQSVPPPTFPEFRIQSSSLPAPLNLSTSVVIPPTLCQLQSASLPFLPQVGGPRAAPPPFPPTPAGGFIPKSLPCFISRDMRHVVSEVHEGQELVGKPQHLIRYSLLQQSAECMDTVPTRDLSLLGEGAALSAPVPAAFPPTGQSFSPEASFAHPPLSLRLSIESICNEPFGGFGSTSAPSRAPPRVERSVSRRTTTFGGFGSTSEQRRDRAPMGKHRCFEESGFEAFGRASRSSPSGFRSSVVETDSPQPQAERSYKKFSSSARARFKFRSRDVDKWAMIFQMQHSEGYWELTTELGELINVDVDAFANVFLKNKGINSLGVKARADILRLVATLLVLQLMRAEELEEGKLLRTLFSMDESELRPERWEQVKRAVDWVRWADRQYPCIYSRLEFGSSWESSTRQLLGYEDLPLFSPLIDLNL